MWATERILPAKGATDPLSKTIVRPPHPPSWSPDGSWEAPFYVKETSAQPLLAMPDTYQTYL
jgi:hypothetical protein